MITQDDFIDTMQGLYQLLPFAKQLSPQAIAMAWVTFPDYAKRDLTPAALQYAAAKLLMDTARDKEKAPHMALLDYLYHLQNVGGSLTIGEPQLEWRLKVDPHNLPPLDGSSTRQALPGAAENRDGRRSEPQGVLAKLAGGAL